MKAAILEKIGHPLVISDIEPPAPMHGQVLVKMLCAGICGSQLQEIDGEKGNPDHCPHLLGHEGCGIVERVGFGIRSVSKGDKVVLHWRKGEGCDADPAIYRRGNEIIKSGSVTTFSEYVVVSENRVTRIDDDVPNDFAALLGCALSTALATVENNIQSGQSVLVIGCGGVGLSMVFVSGILNAFPIVCEDLNKEKKDLAIQNGANDFYPSITEDFYVLEQFGKFDVIIDTVGLVSRFGLLAPSGRYIVIGQKPVIHPLNFLAFFEGEGGRIQATQGGRFNPTKDIPRYVKLWRSGALLALDLNQLITHRISLGTINDGIQLMRDGKAGRVLIEFP